MESHASWEKTVNITLVLAKGMRDKTVGKPSNSGNCDLAVGVLACVNIYRRVRRYPHNDSGGGA